MPALGSSNPSWARWVRYCVLWPHTKTLLPQLVAAVGLLLCANVGDIVPSFCSSALFLFATVSVIADIFHVWCLWMNAMSPCCVFHHFAGAATLAYTVPSMLHLKLYGNTLPWHVRIKDYAILAFGLGGAVLGTTVTVWEIARIHSGAAVPQ